MFVVGDDALFDEAAELEIELLIFLRVVLRFAVEEFEEAFGDDVAELPARARCPASFRARY